MRSPSCRRGRQSGYVLVLSVILLGLFLSLAAAAIDMGNLYVWQLRLDKAVRAGTLAGLGYRSMNGWQVIYGGPPNYTTPARIAQTGNQMEQLLRVAETAVKDNFKMSFPASLNDWTGVEATVSNKLKPLGSNGAPADTLLAAAPNAYDPQQDLITLTYQYEVPTFFAGRLRGTLGGFPMCNSSNGSGCVITSKQTAQLDYANIVMLLDVSGSMTPQINQLRASAQQFSQLFNPFRDRISVIPFNLGAQVSFSFQQQHNGLSGAAHQASFGRDEPTWNAFNTAISALTPQSNTNPCDALINAMSELNSLAGQRSVANSAIRPFVVFFTDGAPNAFRGTFSNMINQGQGGNPSGVPNDWYQYALEWVTGPPRTTYQGPSPLISAQASPFNLVPTALASAPDPATFAGGTPPGSNPYCGDIWSNNTPSANNYFERALNGTTTPAIPGRRPGCLSNLDFSIPNGVPTRVISVLDNTLGDTNAFQVNNQQKFSELPYYCAIEAADQIRTTYNGTVFAIGLGPTSTNPQCDDPLQDPTDYFTRKDNFLSRLAFDPYTYDATGWKSAFNVSRRRAANFNSSCTPTTRSFVGYNVLTNGTDSSRTPAQLSGTEGQYYPTSNPNDLPFLFAQVAKQILLRLNS